jgi:hypothetical protein
VKTVKAQRLNGADNGCIGRADRPAKIERRKGQDVNAIGVYEIGNSLERRRQAIAAPRVAFRENIPLSRRPRYARRDHGALASPLPGL